MLTSAEDAGGGRDTSSCDIPQCTCETDIQVGPASPALDSVLALRPDGAASNAPSFHSYSYPIQAESTLTGAETNVYAVYNYRQALSLSEHGTSPGADAGI